MNNQRIRWIEHKGKQILFVDYSNMTTEQLKPVMEAIISTCPRCDPNSARVCVNVENMKYDLSIISQFNALVSKTKNYMLARAIIGLKDPTTRIMFDSIIRLTGLETMIFNELEDALDWLAERT